MSRVAAVYVPRFPLRVEELRRPELAGERVAVLAPGGGVIGHASPQAEQMGVTVGLPFRQAVALCHGLILLPHDTVAYEKAWEEVLEQLATLSPAVEPAQLGLAYVGLDRRFAGREGFRRLCRALAEAVAPEWGVQVGVAENKFVAYVAACRAWPNEPRRVPGEETAPFLSQQSIHLLPLSFEARRRLEQFGLATMGDLRRLPRSAVQAQFGFAGGRAWDLCWGEDDEPLNPRPLSSRISERVRFPAPATTRQTLLAGCTQLVQRLFNRPERAGRPIRQVRLRALLEEGSWERVFTLKGLAAGPERLLLLLRSALESQPLTRAVEELSLEVLTFGSQLGFQETLFRAGAQRLARLREAVHELKARYGYSPLARVVEVEPWSRIPERRYALVEFDL